VILALIIRINQSAASEYNNSHFNEGNTSLASELALEADRLKAFRTDMLLASAFTTVASLQCYLRLLFINSMNELTTSCCN
jgi:hypothetical protein